MNPSIIDLNKLTREELISFILKFLGLIKDGVYNEKEELYEVLGKKINEINNSQQSILILNESFKKIESKSKKHNIIEGLFELISYFEFEEKYERCATLKKIKDNLLMDL